MTRKIHLICIPFAGGNKYSYKEFERFLPSYLTITAIEFPGRGSRTDEPLLNDIRELTDDIYRQVEPLFSQPYAIYGHSMGGVLAYLLARKILQENRAQPLHLFISGTSGPSCKEDEETYYHLEKKEFVEALSRLGGMPKELLENKEVLDFFEPILRADLRAIDTYLPEPAPPLDIPFTVMIGLDEKVSYEQAMSWQQESSRPIELIELSGNHFFIYDHKKTIMDIIDRQLMRRVPDPQMH